MLYRIKPLDWEKESEGYYSEFTGLTMLTVRYVKRLGWEIYDGQQFILGKIKTLREAKLKAEAYWQARLKECLTVVS